MELKPEEQRSWGGMRPEAQPIRSLGPVNVAAYIGMGLAWVWLLGLDAAAFGVSQASQSEGADKMSSDPITQAIEASLPPIDAQAPAATQTATFAMG